MNDTSNDTLFARIVLDQNLCTEEELLRCKKEFAQRLKENPTTLEQLLTEFGFVTSNPLIG